MYSHETRVALVKERVYAKEQQRRLRTRSGVLVLAALTAGVALGAVAKHRRHPRGG